jgi:hypothetical protein
MSASWVRARNGDALRIHTEINEFTRRSTNSQRDQGHSQGDQEIREKITIRRKDHQEERTIMKKEIIRRRKDAL